MNYEESKEELKKYLLARIPFISINSIEKRRIQRMVTELSKELNMKINVSSMSKGIVDIQDNTLISNEKTAIGILDFIAEDMKKKDNSTYLLMDIYDIDQETSIARYLSDIVTLAEEHNVTIMAITSAKVVSTIQRLGMSVNLDLPDEKELYDLISSFVKTYNNDIKNEWDDNSYYEAANTLLGLSEIEVKNILSSLISRGYLDKQDLVDLKYTKDGMFNNITGLEKIDVEENLTFGGLENLKKWLDEKNKLMSPTKKAEMKSRNIKPPRGILIVGVPGCGKSLAAKAISAKWELPLYLLDLATIQGRYVGQSEQQLKEALLASEYVSPCILWIDEIEKGLAGSNDSNGITNRMIGQFLFWLQECKKDVFVVATANNIDTLPVELVRKGRFDEIFFVDLPNKEERKQIIELYLNKYLKVNINQEFINKLVDLTEGFAGADIEAAIRDITYKIIAEEQKLTPEIFIEVINGTMPLSKTNPEKIEKIKQWGKEHAISASLKEGE